MRRLSWTTWVYLAAIVATAAAAAAIVARPPSASSGSWWAIYAVLALLFLICDSTPVPLGSVGAAMVGAAAVVTARRRVPLPERLFNGAIFAMAGYAAGLAYRAAGGHAHPPMPGFHAVLTASAVRIPSSAVFAPLIKPFAVAAVVHVLVNHVLLWGMLRADRRPGRAGHPGPGTSVALLLASDLGFAALGLVIAALWAVIGPFAAAIVLVPLFVARWAMAQFAEQQR